MFCSVTLLLQDENEYGTFFQSSHKLMLFFFKKFTGKKMISASWFLFLVHFLTVENWLPIVFISIEAPYPQCISPAILTVYEMHYPKEHTWSTFGSFCLPSFICASGFQLKPQKQRCWNIFSFLKGKNTISIKSLFFFY